MAATRTIQPPRLRFPIWRRSITGLGVAISAAAGILLFETEAEFTPPILIAVIGAFALALVLIAISLVAVFLEERDLAELQVRLDRAERAHREALRLSDAAAAEMGLSPQGDPRD